MSGSNPLFRVEDVFGDDIFGDAETRRLDEVLADAGEALDDADRNLDDVARDVRQAVDDADANLDDLAADARQAADDADERLDDVARDAADAADRADERLDDIGDDDAGGGVTAPPGSGPAPGNGGGTPGGEAPAEVKTAFAIIAPANNSGVSGLAIAQLDGNVLEVRVIASNLTPGQVHPLHIHGFTDGRAERLPTLRDDLDGDGVGETPEGESQAFGPVLAALTASGEAQAGLEVSPDFPAADAQGRIVFTQRYVLDQAEADDAGIFSALQARLPGRVIELHGVDVPAGLGAGTPNEANGAPGYNPQVPVAAGQFITLPGVEQTLAGLLEQQPAQLASAVTAFLESLAPYTLNAAGTGPLAPDPLASPAGSMAGGATPPAATPGSGVSASAAAVATGSGATSSSASAGSSASVAPDASGTGAGVSAGATAGASGTLASATAGTTPPGTGAAPHTPVPPAQGAGGVESFAALMLPTNNSGVFGAASITFDEGAGTLAIALELGGLEAGKEHPIHIHGFSDDRASIIPNLQVDADRDGFLEAPEAAPFIGPVILGITEDGSITDAAVAGNYPVADAEGRISLEQSYSFDLGDAGEAALFRELQDRMEGRVLQAHGVTTPATAGEGTRGEVAGIEAYQPALGVANGAILAVDDQGGAFGAALGELVKAGLRGEAPDLEALQATLEAALQPAPGGADTLLG